MRNNRVVDDELLELQVPVMKELDNMYDEYLVDACSSTGRLTNDVSQSQVEVGELQPSIDSCSHKQQVHS